MPVNRNEFETLRNLPNKTIECDIVLQLSKIHTTSKRAEDIVVTNSLGLSITLDVTEKPDIPSYTFNFSAAGVGPICRLDINGTTHGSAGRTHKHELHHDNDPGKNLPTAHALPNLENATLETAWRWLCTQAQIHHDGNIR